MNEFEQLSNQIQQEKGQPLIYFRESVYGMKPAVSMAAAELKKKAIQSGYTADVLMEWSKEDESDILYCVVSARRPSESEMPKKRWWFRG